MCVFSFLKAMANSGLGRFQWPGRDCDSSICERCFGGLHSLQTAFFTWSVRRWRRWRWRPPRQIYHLLGLSLPPSPPSSILRSLALVCLIFFHYITNADQKKGKRRNNSTHTNTHSHTQTVDTTRASCWLEHKAPLRTAHHSLLFPSFFDEPQFAVFFLFSFFQSICYQTSLGMQQSLVGGPAFLAISRMI